MRAYLIVEAQVSDPLAYEPYKQAAQAAIARYGGCYLVRGGAVDVLEGGPAPQRLVVVEFASRDQARKFYHSPEYQAARALRRDAATMNLWVVEGLPVQCIST